MTDSRRDLFAHPRYEIPATEGVIANPLRPASTLVRATSFLARSQSPTGVWPCIVRSAVRPTAEYVVLLTLLDRIRRSNECCPTNDCLVLNGSDQVPCGDAEASPPPIAKFDSWRQKIRSAAAHIASQQTPVGLWNASTRPHDLDTSVLAYLALRLAGHDAQTEHLERARQAIVAAGGIDACDPLTHYAFAVLGELDFQECLPLPPVFCLLPAAIPGATARNALLTRIILTSVSILRSRSSNQHPVQNPSDIPRILNELIAGGGGLRSQRRLKLNRQSTYRLVNRVMKWSPSKRTWLSRTHAVAAAEASLLKTIGAGTQGGNDRENRNASRSIVSDVVVGAFGGAVGDATATIWAALALLSGGRDESDVAIRSCLGFLDSLQVTSDGLTEVGLAQADLRCTAIACRALGVAGVTMVEVPMQRSVDWLLRNESHRTVAESSVTETSGWSAQGGRNSIVDAESTALVLLALREQFTETPPRVSTSEDSMVAIVRASSATFARRQIALLDRMAAASRRSRRWLIQMQNTDGGWGRFDRCPRVANNRKSAWSKDLSNFDMSSPIVTSWVLEALARWDLRRESIMRRAVAFLRGAQQPDGRWVENGEYPILATWRAVTGLTVAGVPSQDPAIASAIGWLTSEQLKSGGWRDGAASDSPQTTILEPASVVHTAWALLALIEVGAHDCSVTRRAVQFLQQHQQSDGSWHTDELATGYRASMACGTEPYASIAWPVMALASWSRTHDRASVVG